MVTVVTQVRLKDGREAERVDPPTGRHHGASGKGLGADDQDPDHENVDQRVLRQARGPAEPGRHRGRIEVSSSSCVCNTRLLSVH